MDATSSKQKPAKAAGQRAPKAGRPAPAIDVRVSWCKGCGLCVDYCKRGTLEMQDHLPRVVRAETCSRCLMCEAICPDFAIEVREAPAADGAGADS